MPIQRAEQFERAARKGVGHVKSRELKDVINKLRLYHNNTAVSATLRDHLLVDLRDALVKWSKKHPKEFATRDGAKLSHEVMVELATSTAEHLELRDGDILFRWVPSGIGQRKNTQFVISSFQAALQCLHEIQGLAGINLDASVFLVQHVGIYSSNQVIEIGPSGLERNTISNRPHYDLVVRSQSFGHGISNIAKSALCGSSYYSAPFKKIKYPVNDLVNVMQPRHGTRFIDHDLGLHANNEQYRQKAISNVLQQRVICSHFVNAVLYAAVKPGGTLAAATDHGYDKTFKISPAQMWREFMGNQGIWSNMHAHFVGLQHKGNLDRNIDPRELRVGLRQPPVPKKTGRPPLAPPLA